MDDIKTHNVYIKVTFENREQKIFECRPQFGQLKKESPSLVGYVYYKLDSILYRKHRIGNNHYLKRIKLDDLIQNFENYPIVKEE